MPSSSSVRRFVKLAARTSLLLVVVSGADFARADWKDDVGYTTLKNTLNSIGVAVPNGAIRINETTWEPVSVALVESVQVQDGNRNYKPDPSGSEFSAVGDPLGQAVTWVDASSNNCDNPSTSGVVEACIGYTTHPRGMAWTILGNTQGLAPAANKLTLYEANNYLSSVLRAPNNGTPISQAQFRVQNLSWVGSYGNEDQNRSTLRRFDFMIDRDNVTAVVGLDNNLDPLPGLLGQSYNAITVGKRNGNHSTGPTNITNYGTGRSKPDIVAPQNTSSLATASVSSAATLLHSVVAGTDAANSEVIKAMLMAGATKNEFPTWSRTTTQPLDGTFGAGELNIFNSYLMTQGGRYAGSKDDPVIVGSHGWDYQTILQGPSNGLKYKFSIPEGSFASELSILLTWNVSVSSAFGGQTLADFNMTLTDSLDQIVDQSLSAVNNVEHIYIGGNQPISSLGPGEYTLSITSDTIRDFGLAWRMSTKFDVLSADFDEDGDVDGRDFLAWQRGFGTLINATHAQGDANGDGAVNAADLLIFHDQFGPVVVDPPVSFYAIPEPGSAVLIGSGLVMFFLARRRCV